MRVVEVGLTDEMQVFRFLVGGSEGPPREKFENQERRRSHFHYFFYHRGWWRVRVVEVGLTDEMQVFRFVVGGSEGPPPEKFENQECRRSHFRQFCNAMQLKSKIS